MSVTLLRITGEQPNEVRGPVSPAADSSAAVQLLLNVLHQLEPLGRSLVQADGSRPSWVLKSHRTDRETVLQLEAGGNACGRISYWFDGSASEQLCSALDALDNVAVSVGGASYQLSLEARIDEARGTKASSPTVHPDAL